MTELEQAGEADVGLDVPEAGRKHTEPPTGWGQLPPRGSCAGLATTATEAWTGQEEGCTWSAPPPVPRWGQARGRVETGEQEEGTSLWMEQWLCPRHNADRTLGTERALRARSGLPHKGAALLHTGEVF